MKPSLFDKLATLRAARIEAIDAQEIAPRIRNHLLQLFRAAHAVEPGLTGVICGMGHADLCGEYMAKGDQELDAHPDDKGPLRRDAGHWDESDTGTTCEPIQAATQAFFLAVSEYDGLVGGDRGLPYIDDITLDDLKTTRAKKAAIHGPRGLRARGAK